MKCFFASLLSILIFISFTDIAIAANEIPGSADSGRFEADKKLILPTSPPKYSPPTVPKTAQDVKVPKEAKDINFTLKNVIIEGAEIFTKEQLKPFYINYLNQEISLDTVWNIASNITNYYQNNGYFLSKAQVPEQAIGNGVLKIKIIEGYVGKVEFKNSIGKNYVSLGIVKNIMSQKPIKIKSLEESLLALNDLPGVSFRSIVKPLDEVNGAIKLILVGEKKKGHGHVNFDNYNSMYLGPYQGEISYSKSIIPLNQTNLTLLNSAPENKLRYFSASNDFTFAPGWTFGIYGGHTSAKPGFTLKPFEIVSTSDNFGISLTKQIIRQRQQNLKLKLAIEGKDVSSNILFAPLTRDRIRSVALNLAYNGSDKLGGYNYINSTITQGISGLGASNKGDLFLSRQNVETNFNKVEFSFNRFQNIGKSLMSVFSGAMQFSSGPLYSSDQFGYGGQAFGRAYDSSEISGDQGMSAGLEMRYTSIPVLKSIKFVPFIFYDVGKVWSDGEVSRSRNSFGEGFRVSANKNLSATFTIAHPLMHGVATPRYTNTKRPQYLLQISRSF